MECFLLRAGDVFYLSIILSMDMAKGPHYDYNFVRDRI